MGYSSSSVKITSPVLTDILQRRRLFRLLDKAMKKPVVWVSSPGGAGKTTLIASYLQDRKLPFIWYQVDESDSDIATFFYHMGLAAKKAMPRKKTNLPPLTPEYLTDVETFARRYFDRLYSMLKPPFAIIFDNYQDARHDSEFQGIISRGMALIPDGINVIVISRFDPPKKFARQRANRTMDMIAWDDVRFTLDETREMLRLGGHGDLSDGTLHRMYEKTDGWAAGLVLLLEKARHGDITEDLIAKVTRESIFDYFASEIFDSAGNETKDFLLKTAFLPQIAPPVAEQLTGAANAGRILSALSKEHFFTTRQGTREASYQYHALFREYLLSRAAEIFSGKEISAIQKKAASLLSKHGDFENATALYIKAKDWSEVIRLTRSHAPSLFGQGRSGTVKEWLDSLPPELVEADGDLLFFRGLCWFTIDSGAGQREYLEKALVVYKKKGDVSGMFEVCSAAAGQCHPQHRLRVRENLGRQA